MDVEKGKIITLIGANGAKKSTTLMTICGITRARQGEIYFQGNPIHDMTPDKIVALGINQVPEGRHIFPYLTVMENLNMGTFFRKDTENIKKAYLGI